MDTQLSPSDPAGPGGEPPEQTTDAQTEAANGDEPDAAGEPAPRCAIFISHKRDFDRDYDMRLAACLSGTNRIEWNSLADYAQLLERVRSALRGKPPSRDPTEVLGMEGFLVRDSRKRRMSAAFISPLYKTPAGDK